MFARLLDIQETADERRFSRTQQPFMRRFRDSEQELRWKNLKQYGSIDGLLLHFRRMERRAVRSKVGQPMATNQGLFLEMFGDTRVNPKGWDVCPLEELTERQRPITYGIVQAGPHVEDGILLRVSRELPPISLEHVLCPASSTIGRRLSRRTASSRLCATSAAVLCDLLVADLLVPTDRQVIGVVAKSGMRLWSSAGNPQQRACHPLSVRPVSAC